MSNLDDRIFADYLMDMRLEEAIASVSLSHNENCKCKVCLAACGDKAAFLYIKQDISEITGEQ